LESDGATAAAFGGTGAQKTSLSHAMPLFLEGGCSMMYLNICLVKEVERRHK
jgi:hypothetical protein